MARVKVVFKPERVKRRGRATPKPPPWIHKYLHRVNTVVEYQGARWELVYHVIDNSDSVSIGRVWVYHLPEEM